MGIEEEVGSVRGVATRPDLIVAMSPSVYPSPTGEAARGSPAVRGRFTLKADLNPRAKMRWMA